MEGYVLGPVRAEGADGGRVFGRSKAAALFALLMTSPGYRCTRKEIAEVLWEGDGNAGGRVDRAISDLRKQLGREIVPQGRSGYCVLRVPEGGSDLHRLRAGMARAAGLSPAEQFE
ncbi:AfsR/SARP family transcriptional regulator [Streptomyces sp. NPDC012600]|uniref:AfsR/SARP family transcriptional regulator n=1 Tax=Streptomyces sp. NPDC012600 TaxID=3415005 RepID=UPI003C2F4CE6